MAEERSNSWPEWSQHVLKELERLNTNFESIRAELTDIREEMAEIRATTTVIGELKQWKKDIDDIASPSQLRDMKLEIERLKNFKTVSTTAWVIVQLAFGITIAILNYLK